MSETALLAIFFVFVMSGVLGALVLFEWRTSSRPGMANQPPPQGGIAGGIARALNTIGETFTLPARSDQTIRRELIAAGYRTPEAPDIFHGAKLAVACLLALGLGWVGLLGREDPTIAVLLAVCGAGFGFLLPDRFLDARVASRSLRLERALPSALDLMVLSVEAGQTLDVALLETSRELRSLYPELAGEFTQAQLELRAGRSRAEVLYDLGQRTGSAEVRKLVGILIDTDRFGTSLGPALRTHARYLRTRRRNEAQEAARKLGVKMIFPVFFLIMPSVFVITLGPALLQIYMQLIPMLRGN